MRRRRPSEEGWDSTCLLPHWLVATAATSRLCYVQDQLQSSGTALVGKCKETQHFSSSRSSGERGLSSDNAGAGWACLTAAAIALTAGCV